MIDRTYLPYKSAREYVDRGMAKWMGFFISEHSSALTKAGDSVDFKAKISSDKKMLILHQLLFSQLPVLLYTDVQKNPFLGTIHEINAEKIYLKTKDALPNFQFEQILSLTLAEDLDHE